MTKKAGKEQSDLLYESILTLKDLEECKEFFQDLCTVAELRAMEQRFEVALLLSDGMIYNDILERTGASSATISRVNRALHYGANGYQQVLPRAKELRRQYEEEDAMSSYEALAARYDALTADVDHAAWADYLEKHFARCGQPIHTVLDLACGTGTMTSCLLAERGYETIGVDRSADMLSVAAEKGRQVSGIPPLFLQQSMQELDLYGTVDACVCCLDSVNYVTRPAELLRAFRRVCLFLVPGGLFLFDINTPEKLQGLDGGIFLDETEDTYCVWRADYSRRSRLCTYGMDLFFREEDGLWRREGEVHQERAYTPEELTALLQEAGLYRRPAARRTEAAPPQARGAAYLFYCAKGTIIRLWMRSYA